MEGEYKLVQTATNSLDSIEVLFNQLGRDRWQLVTVTVRGNERTYYFERCRDFEALKGGDK